MGKIEFELRVPADMSSITLGDYQKYVKIVQGFKEGEDSEDFLKLKMLEIFCGVELKDSYKLPISVFEGAINQVQACLLEETPLHRRFTFNTPKGDTPVEFGFIPKLDDMSFGEYVDLDTTITDMDTLHRSMAVLYRPITNRKKDAYSIEDYEGYHKYADLMKDMPLNVSLGALVFFYRLGMKLSKYTTVSSLKQLATTPERLLALEKKLLEQNGVGINQYMHLLEETSSNLTRLPSSHSGNVLYG